MTADPTVLARSLALDVVREHLPSIERARTVAEARATMEATIEQARRVLAHSTGQGNGAELDRAVEELLARMVVMQRPRIDRFGRIYDAGTGGTRAWLWITVGLVVAGLAAAGIVLERGS